jgi:hypothetical protein
MSGFMNSLLGAFAGAGRGIAQQQQFNGQRADDDIDRRIKGFQLAALEAGPQTRWSWDTKRKVFTSESGETREVPGIKPAWDDEEKPHYDAGRGGYVQPGRAFQPVEGLPEAPQGAPRNIDPLSPEGIDAAAKRAAAVAAATPRPKSAQRALPSSAVEKLVGIDNMLSMATEVRDGLQKAATSKTNVTGRIGGIIPTATWMKNLANVGGDEGKDVRAMIGNLYGTVAKERGGSALSAAEIKLLESYIPNENEDEHTATIKANRFIRVLRSMRENKLKAYQQFGFGVDDEAPTQDQPQYSPNNPFVKRP